MPADLWSLYPWMLKSRLFEESIAALWQQGLISGEMHLGTGEEAIVAGIVSQLREGDAMALDHRGTAAMLVRGIDPVAILREMLGQPDGLCGGMGGHMHLMSKEHLAAASGIVGASGPAAAGFALAAEYLRPGAVAVAFFGDGAINQGMLMESMNLAAAWALPVVFVCKDDGWAISTDSGRLTGADLSGRAGGLGLPFLDVDGEDAVAVWDAAELAITRARSGGGPTFIRMRCFHLEAHFLGLQLERLVRKPLTEARSVAAPVVSGLFRRGGANIGMRIAGVASIAERVVAAARDRRRDRANDPLVRARLALRSEPARLEQLEATVVREINSLLNAALKEIIQ
jgi:TPP-dependent pyruvate/acetoin dehydrogenase alpha subunit